MDIQQGGIPMLARYQTASLLLALLLARPEAAHAQPERSGNRVKQEFRRALKLAQGGKMNEAIAIWEDVLTRADGEVKEQSHFNLAFAYEEIGKLPEAWHHLGLFIRNVKKEDQEAERELDRLEQILLKGHVKMGIVCDPPQAQVFIGRTARGIARACPVTWWFKPGKQAVYLVHKGFRDKLEEFQVLKRGGVASHLVKLEPRAAKPVPKKDAYGMLVVEGKGRALQVFLDGALEGGVPFRRKLKAGTYELMVGKPRKRPWKKMITIKPGETLVETPAIAQPEVVRKPDPPKDDGKKKTGIPGKGPGITKEGTGGKKKPIEFWKWTVVGTGVAALMTGGILHYASYSNELDLYDKYQYADQQDAYNKEYQDRVKPKYAAAQILYGVGGVTALTGLVFLAMSGDDQGSPSSKSARLSPMVAPGRVGLNFQLDF